MRTTRASTAAVTFLPPTCNNDDDDDLTHLWQRAFCDLLSGAAKHIAEPSVVLLQTNDWKGLSQITEQTPMDYAYTLIGCGIVSVIDSRQMHNKVEVHRDTLKAMLEKNHLMANRESNSYCYVSDGKIYEGALKENRPANAPKVSSTKAAELLTLRIGKPQPGGKPPIAQKAINSCGARPKFSWKMRKVLCQYHTNIRPLVSKAYFDEKMRNDARIVAQWMVDPPQFFDRKFIKKTKPPKDTATNSPPRKKGNTAATPPRDTEMKGAKDQEVTSQQQLQDDLMAVFEKHGLLDKWKEQLPHDDLKPPPSQFYESATIPTATAAVTPSHVFPLREEATTSDSATNITDPPQVREDSYYTGVDRIFQDEGANRAAHFGRKFNGVNLRTIMDKADHLFGTTGRIRVYLIEKAPAKVDMINAKCDDIAMALGLWDSAFSKLRTVDPTSEDCDSAQKLIDTAVAQLRKMGISITPKVHGSQYHAVHQMRTIPGGIAKLGEDWIEKYHQDGFRYDFCFSRVGDLEKQAVIRARCEQRARNPKVVMRRELVTKRFKGKRKKKGPTVKKVQKQIKEEKRHEVLLKAIEENVVELY